MKVILTALALAGLVTAAAGQELDAQELAASQARFKALYEGRYLAAADALRPLAFDADGKPRAGFAYDEWRQTQALMTGEPPARPAGVGEAYAPDANDMAAAAALRAAEPGDAITEIVRRARDTRIVILNEDHGQPRHRAFGLEVARALRPLGYDVLAIETLSNDADAKLAASKMVALARDGFPRRTTGYYSLDPVFADFIRHSLQLGYRPVAYEQTNRQSSMSEDSIAPREQAQADYIVARALKAYPRSKLLIYVGWSHATENPQPTKTGAARRWLATRLKAQTGIDPLTIDQTTLIDAGGFHSVLYGVVADRLRGRSSVMLTRGAPLVVGPYKGLIDLQVAHPRTRRISGRPDWLAAMGRTPSPIPVALLPATGTRLVQAFIATEGADALPVDQVLVTAGAPIPKLLLPKVRVRYAVEDPLRP